MIANINVFHLNLLRSMIRFLLKRQVILCLAHALLLVLIIQRIMFRQKIESLKDEIRNLGYPASAEEVAEWYEDLNPVRPGRENGASILQEAIDYRVPLDEEYRDVWKLVDTDIPIAEELIPIEQRESVKRYLQESRETLDLFHTGARHSHCRFPIEL